MAGTTTGMGMGQPSINGMGVAGGYPGLARQYAQSPGAMGYPDSMAPPKVNPARGAITANGQLSNTFSANPHQVNPAYMMQYSGLQNGVSQQIPKATQNPYSALAGNAQGGANQWQQNPQGGGQQQMGMNPTIGQQGNPYSALAGNAQRPQQNMNIAQAAQQGLQWSGGQYQPISNAGANQGEGMQQNVNGQPNWQAWGWAGPGDQNGVQATKNWQAQGAGAMQGLPPQQQMQAYQQTQAGNGAFQLPTTQNLGGMQGGGGLSALYQNSFKQG